MAAGRHFSEDGKGLIIEPEIPAGHEHRYGNLQLFHEAYDSRQCPRVDETRHLWRRRRQAKSAVITLELVEFDGDGEKCHETKYMQLS
jgi:hypothetical protein